MRRSLVAFVAGLLALPVLPAAAQTAGHTLTHETVESKADGTRIAITIFEPAGASAETPVPVILSSHGWGGNRETSIGGRVKALLDAGFGVVSIDQRGHGASEGEANVQDPELETEDIKTVIDRIALLDWVRLDGPNDPVLGAVGASYGGGYQTMTALDEIADEGRTRFNAIAPEITWYDLPESLAPQKVVRTLWVSALYAAGAAMVPQFIHEAQAWGTATGQWPDGTLYGQPAPGIVPDLDEVFHRHSPVAFVEQGHQIDIPVLLRQGITDNLFNLNQGLDIFDKAVSDEAREQSYLVGYNGGHALPSALPAGTAGGTDPCSPGGFTALTIEFFERVFAGESTEGLMSSRYNLANVDGTKCLRFDSLDRDEIAVDPAGAGLIVTPTSAGAPLSFEIARGPIAVAGVPTLSGNATALGLDSRAFFALSVGTSPADARIIQNNTMPLRVLRTSVDMPFEIELPGIAIDVPEGQSLFLTISPVADMFAGHGSRTAAGIVLTDVGLSLPSPVTDVVELLATQMSVTRERTGSSFQLIATLTESASGTGVGNAPVEFFADGVPIGTATTAADGTAALDLEGRYRGGHHVFEARFGGSDSHEGSSGTTET